MVGVDSDNGKEITTGRIVWTGQSEQTIDEILSESEGSESGTKVDAAADWLVEFLSTQPGCQASSVNVKVEGGVAGHSERNLQRALHRAGVTAERSSEFPAGTWWALSNESDIQLQKEPNGLKAAKG